MLKCLQKRHLFLFGCFFIILLFAGYKNCMVTDKYITEWGIENLFNNYYLFSTNFRAFLANTISLHEADTESGWKSFYYLYPLFLFLKLPGSLNLQNLYFFNFAISVVSLILFYRLCENYLGRQVANISTFFLVFSSWLFEFTMSSSYHSPTILIALALIYLMFDCLNKPRVINYFLLGITTALSLYYYGVIRFLLPIIAILLLSRKEHFYSRFVYFLSGLAPLLILSFLLRNNYPERLFDQENIFCIEPGYSKTSFLRWLDNLKFLLKALSGQHISSSHATLINKILVIPLIGGFVHVLRKLEIKSYRLLLIIAMTIMLLPVFTTSFHWQPRRFVLYLIPVYIMIGIGGSRIIHHISFIKRKILRLILYWFIVSVSFYVITAEYIYARCNIWSGRYDKGFVNLGKRIKEFSIEGPILYLQETPQRLYEIDCEATLLKLILNDKNRNYDINEITNLERIDNISNEVYIVKSPFIDKKSFSKMCERKNLLCKLILSVPYKGSLTALDDAFRLYFVKKIK